MRTHVIISTVVAGLLTAAAPVSAATIFVSPTGADTGTCGSPASPCKTLQRGHDRVDPGGTVLLSEPGTYGPATLNKSLNVRGVPGAGIFSPGATSCLTINGGGNDTIVLDGLVCDM